MRIRAQLIFVAILWTTATTRTARADDADDAKVRNSVVKIFATLRRPDVFRPWSKENQEEATGSGVVITGKRILTNTHMVNHSSQVFIQPDKSSDKLAAKVEALAPGIDLAVLKLDDESFFDDHPPLPLRPQLPKIQQTIFAYGYPEGGTDLSITRGIVSHVEYAEYYLHVEGLRIQVDAAINPGNSGGPAVADGQMVGLVFSRLSQSDNIGYIIPMEEIELFLKDIQDGHYDGKPILDTEVQKLEMTRFAPSSSSIRRLRGFWYTRSMPVAHPIRSTLAISSPGSEITPSTMQVWYATKATTISSSSIWCSTWYATITSR